jgi:hypothetical protein
MSTQPEAIIGPVDSITSISQTFGGECVAAVDQR